MIQRLTAALMFALGMMALLAAVPTGAQPDLQPTVREELSALGFLIGQWTVDSDFRLGDGRRERTEATSTFEIDLGGAMIRERYHGTRDSQPFAALGVLCYSEVWDRMQHSWLDADHGMTVYEGVEGHAGLAAGDFVFEYQLELRGQTHILQHGFTEIGDDSFVAYSRRSMDDRATWRETWRATYTRVSDD